MSWVAPFCSPTQPFFPQSNPSRAYYSADQKAADEKFIKTFESNCKLQKITNQPKRIKLSEGRLCLSQIIKEKESIKHQLNSLNGTEDNFENQVSVLRERILDLNNKINTFQNNIPKMEINKKIKKRERLRRKKQELNEIKKKKRDDIIEKHKAIEKLLSEKAEEIERVKREAALKRQADSVLHEVRRKKYEAKKMLNLLTALKKLRELRSKEEEERGGYCSKALMETFNQVIDRFQTLWKKQSGIYDLEEKGLKIMLEENSPPQSKESDVVNNILEWEKALFGDVSVMSEHEEMLNAGNTDFNAMVEVRRDWDRFLAMEPTPMASSIPPGWVLPSAKDNNEWKTHFI